MAKTALLITLGLGTGVESGVARAVATHHADLVLFLASAQSRDETLPKVEELHGGLENCDVRLIGDVNDIEDCFAAARESIEGLLRGGYRVTADFTSGTKAMSAGLAIAATALGVESLSYVAGQRDENGRVISGTERVITLVPNVILADAEKRSALRLFNCYQFDACRQVAEDVLGRIAAPQIAGPFQTLKALAEAYSAWDRFDHQGAWDTVGRLPEDGLTLFHAKGPVRCNKYFLRCLLRAAKEHRHPAEHVADLLCNAARRAEEGKWDDAVARLYRTVELIAQRRLLTRHGLDTSNLDVEKLPREVRGEYESLRGEKSGQVTIGVARAYGLLGMLGDPLAVRYEGLRGPLAARNNSILAHGLEPVRPQTYERLRGDVCALAREAIPGLEKLEKQARFPRLRE